MMKITVLGCGAIGQLWMLKLAAAGHSVQGWLRQPHTNWHCMLAENSQSYTEKLNNSFSDHHRPPAVPQVFPVNQKDHLAHSQLLLVTLKAGSVQLALPALLHTLPADCPILLLHNGMGSVPEAMYQSIKQPLLQGITTHGALRVNRHTVRHTGVGATHIGGINPRGHAYSTVLANTLDAALPTVSAHQDIRPFLWQKLAINCAINPLTALKNCRNGALRAFPDEIRILCTEVATVMNALGLPADTHALYQQVMQVIDATAENYSSMQQDIAKSRETEIAFITGYLLEQARQLNIPTPANSALYQAIMQQQIQQNGQD